MLSFFNLFSISLFVIGTFGEFMFCGTNEAGLGFNSGTLPGVLYKNYVTPSDSSIDFFSANGMNIIRLSFIWERLQPTLNTELNATYLGYIDGVVQYITVTKKMFVLLDVHNYARYQGNILGSSALPYSAFGDLWTRLATKYVSNNNVIFGLMNEPHDMPYTDVLGSMQYAINSIRATGAKQWIFVPGNDWTGAHSWMGNSYKYMINITDPENRFMYEMHQYFDQYSSGTQPCDPSFNINTQLVPVTNWLRNNNRTAFLGEFGIENTTQCLAVFDNVMKFLKNNTDVWKGFTYWAAGPWWGSYMYSIEPSGGASQPQFDIMKNYFPQTYAPAYPVSTTSHATSAHLMTSGKTTSGSHPLTSSSITTNHVTSAHITSNHAGTSAAVTSASMSPLTTAASHATSSSVTTNHISSSSSASTSTSGVHVSTTGKSVTSHSLASTTVASPNSNLSKVSAASNSFKVSLLFIVFQIFVFIF